MPQARVFCGGDHLGPLTWRNLPEAEAHAQGAGAGTRVCSGRVFQNPHRHQYAPGGTTIPPPGCRMRPSPAGARSCARRRRTLSRGSAPPIPGAPAPVYVIGSEVPIPGGAMENEETVAVTKPEDCKATLEAFQAAFTRRGLKDAWDRVIALVVQPGVEFADESVVEYDRAAARDLTASLDACRIGLRGALHDYQSRSGCGRWWRTASPF